METFSASLAICAGNSPVSGEFPAQRPVTRSFDVFFDLRPNKRLSKHCWGWWFETPSWSLWRQCNVLSRYPCLLMTCQHKGQSTSSHVIDLLFLEYCGLSTRRFWFTQEIPYYSDVIMSAMASHHRRPDCPTVCSGAKKTSKLRVTGLCDGKSPVHSPHKGPVTRKMFLFDDVIMNIKSIVFKPIAQNSSLGIRYEIADHKTSAYRK